MGSCAPPAPPVVLPMFRTCSTPKLKSVTSNTLPTSKPFIRSSLLVKAWVCDSASIALPSLAGTKIMNASMAMLLS